MRVKRYSTSKKMSILAIVVIILFLSLWLIKISYGTIGNFSFFLPPSICFLAWYYKPRAK